MTPLPDLKLKHPSIKTGDRMSDLKRFLYVGGASLDARWGVNPIENGKLGRPQIRRLELLKSIKEQLETYLVTGISYSTVKSTLSALNKYFQFIDNNQLQGSLDKLDAEYFDFAEQLFQATQKKSRRINENTAYHYASNLSRLFGRILETSTATPLIAMTRLKYPKNTNRALGKSAEKQNLEDTFTLGNFLVDIINGLTIDSIHGQLPMNIPITSGLVKDDQVKLATSSVDWLEQPAETLNQNQRISAAKIANVRAPTKNINGTRRWQYVNLRVNAEFLVFLAHSGMNVSEAASLRKCSFKYKSSGDSWVVRSYKNRRGGEVEFTIYKSYKPFLENHLKFIRHFFPDSPWLFPIISHNGLEIGSRHIWQYKVLKTFLSKYKIPWISPKTLRKTRVNWLLRRSGDENLTAEMAQHTINVLRGQYERPSQQRAMVEITRFWTRHDPIKKNQLKSSVIASDCNGIPKALPNKPRLVVEPNCINPSGCLWCKHHRDSDTADYVWSLTSMRHLKCIEAGDSKSRNPIAADEVIDRLSEKINWYRNSNDIRKSWTEEAEQRIKEGYYHPNWGNIIEFLE